MKIWKKSQFDYFYHIDIFWLVQLNLDQFGPSLTHLSKVFKYLCIVCSPLLSYTKQFGPIWTICDQFGHILEYVDPLTHLDCLWPSWTHLSHLIHWTYLDNYQLPITNLISLWAIQNQVDPHIPTWTNIDIFWSHFHT